MKRQSQRRWLQLLGATLAIVLVIAAVWAAAPEDLRGLFLIVGGVLYAVTTVGGYAIERRIHW